VLFPPDSALLKFPRRTRSVAAREVVPAADATRFFVERYHRAFDEEAAVLAPLLTRFASRLARQSPNELLTGFARVVSALAQHCSVQEAVVYPTIDANEQCTPGEWSMLRADMAALRDLVEEVRADLEPLCASTGAPLLHRLRHFYEEIARHLDDEEGALRSREEAPAALRA
jgi:iron-sulfur cluster repair protein YtfE (RIC family)